VPEQPDTARAAAIRTKYKHADGPLALFAGRLVIEKGVDDLLRAVALLRGEMDDLRLVIAGTGQDQTALEALTRDLELEDRVSFVGWIAPDDVASYMAAADMFVGPSKQSVSGWREGLGLVFLESMAAGTPEASKP
ncbi:MAG: glycosyltransferase, partial [Phycisphaeraceae bacterium]|nr:glycosyltransferase [Phycisphaeraceae bacterium]